MEVRSGSVDDDLWARTDTTDVGHAQDLIRRHTVDRAGDKEVDVCGIGIVRMTRDAEKTLLAPSRFDVRDGVKNRVGSGYRVQDLDAPTLEFAVEDAPRGVKRECGGAVEPGLHNLAGDRSVRARFGNAEQDRYED
jgi:hypothetical protein